jgi:hypothetical protein
MIMALLMLYFLGGGVGSGAMLTSAGVDQLQDQVVAVVKDDARSKRATTILKSLKKEVRAFEKAFAKSGRQLNKLFKDPGDNREQALLILNDLNANWEARQLRALDARFGLRDELTEQEWKALFAMDQASTTDNE